MKIVCDACSAKYSIADEKVAGKVFKIRCKKCSNVIVVRGAQDAEVAAAPEQLEQKETRVFDYSGYDNPQEAVAAAESSIADGGVWHVVIDQEQVGPMTPDEVRQRFAAGEIDAESFIWREGFADWERVDALAEFADLAAGQAGQAGHAGNGANVDDAAAAMFGGPALDEGVDASDPADLFTAQAGGVAVEASGGIFGGAADDGGLFGGGAAAEPAVMAAAPEAVDERLTGERNENSVLFSLNNLASLASDSPKAAAPTPVAAASSGGTGMAQSGGQEGSGLIDIRAMASMYVGGNENQPARGGSIDDLPVFSQPAIASASPVLMPVAAPANNNRLLVALIAGIGALLLVAVLLVVLVLKGGDDGETKTAANDTDDSSKNATGDGDGDGDATKTGDGDGSSAEAGKEPGAGKTLPAKDDEAAKAKAEEAARKKAEREAAREEAARKRAEKLKNETPAEKRRRLKKEKEDREKAKKRREAAKAKRDAARAAAAAKKPPSSGGGCDELTCLVEPNKACCKRRGGSSSKPKPKDSSLPERPSKSQIKKGMGRASGSVKRCGSKNSFSGRVSVKIRVGSSGRVSSASASGGKGGVNSCVASAVKRSARFPKTQKGISFSYSYRL